MVFRKSSLSTLAISLLIMYSSLPGATIHQADFTLDPMSDPVCINCHIPGGTTPDVIKVSQICMDCHTEIQNDPAISGTTWDTATVNPHNHPLFVDYALSTSESLKPIGTLLNGTWDNANTIEDLLPGNQLLCTSCHNHHTAALRADDGFTALCLGCHLK